MTRAVAGIIRATLGVAMLYEADVVRGTSLSQPTAHRLLKGDKVFDLAQLEEVCAFLRIDPVAVLSQAQQQLANRSSQQ